MKYESIPDFIKKHLKYRQHWNKKTVSMTDARWQTLIDDTWIDGCAYAKDSRFKVFETSNFGWIVFGPEVRTPDGYAPGKRIIRY